MRGSNATRLIHDYKLSRDDFFTLKRMGKEITVLRRPGVDKVINEVEMVIDEFSVDVKLVPGHCIATATIKAHLPEDPLNTVWTCASASPLDCLSTNKRYPETAEKRVKQRAVLSLIELYELGIETVDSAADFAQSDPDLTKKDEEKSVQPPPILRNSENVGKELEEEMTKLNKIRKKR